MCGDLYIVRSTHSNTKVWLSMCDAFGARTVITRISSLHLDVDRGQNGKGGPTCTRTDDTALLIHLVTGTPSFTSPYAVASLTRSCDVINGDVWPTCRWRDLFFCRSFLCMRCTPLEYPSDAHDHFDSNRTASAHNLQEQREKRERERPNATSNGQVNHRRPRGLCSKNRSHHDVCTSTQTHVRDIVEKCTPH